MSDAGTEPACDVFVSYNSADRDRAERIAQALAARGLEVFFDRWELVPGQPWTDALERHIDACRGVAVLLGPSGMSTWQHREQHLALIRQASKPEFKVIPVLLPGAEPALGFLSLNTWIDLRADIDDEEEIARLINAVRGEDSRDTSTPHDGPHICPYRGLEVFREEDAPFFFGRRSFTQLLVERIHSRRLIAVVGASGSGKSSVVQAGLIPALRNAPNGTTWDCLSMKPGREALAALVRTFDPPESTSLITARAAINAAASRLRNADVTLEQLASDYLARQPGTDRLLLIVDQFEELATLTSDSEERARFIDLLLAATGQGGELSVVLALRGDFFSQVLQRRDLNDRLQDAVIQIGPLSAAAGENERSELETVIRNPAEAIGMAFEDGLVGRIISDVGDEPGNLPLLEYLLTELWHQRSGNDLTHAAYEALGGVQGAIARRADEVFDQLQPTQQDAARRLFLSLVRTGEGQQDTRVPAAFPASPGEAAVADRFTGPGVRLLVANEDTLQGRFVEISHEALIRNWGKLQGWIDENRDALRVRERVRTRMRRWRKEDEPDDLLLPPGVELEEGRRLLTLQSELSIDEVRDYVELSFARDQERIARELAAEQRKRTRIIQALAVSVLLLVFSAWQWRQTEAQKRLVGLEKKNVQQQAERANLEADLAVASRLAALSTQVLENNAGEAALAP